MHELKMRHCLKSFMGPWLWTSIFLNFKMLRSFIRMMARNVCVVVQL